MYFLVWIQLWCQDAMQKLDCTIVEGQLQHMSAKLVIN
jgi:hypothetical protein